MGQFAWVTLLKEVSPAALTVRAQTVSPNDRGMLKWDRFFPRKNVNSIRIREILTLDSRVAADRREWNAPPRRLTLETPSFKDMEMVPIEAEYVIDEYEMQLLNERTDGNAQLLQNILKSDLPGRVDTIASSDYRRLDIDVFQAWSSGTITIRNPQDASKTYTASYKIDSSRYQTAATAWNDVSVNAYNEATAWLQDAVDMVGPVEGMALRTPTLNAIQADAPNPFGNTVPEITIRDIEKRIEDKLGNSFYFERMEQSHDVYVDGGTTKVRTKVWAAQKVAAIPAGTAVGDAAFAPVVRAGEIAQQVPGGVDVRGVTVYYLERNDGKQLCVQGQLNAFPVPDEQRICVIDAGV